MTIMIMDIVMTMIIKQTRNSLFMKQNITMIMDINTPIMIMITIMPVIMIILIIIITTTMTMNTDTDTDTDMTTKSPRTPLGMAMDMITPTRLQRTSLSPSTTCIHSMELW
eukprot:gene3632-4808_t